LKADSPWQCLATCIELTGALRSSDPTKFMSRIPIHQDGTCNGLQHYCALGGDIVGAKLVNLIPNEKPSDIYSNVAENIKQRVAQDVAEGNELAKLIQPLITRKVVKQPVMTTTYGVTERGAAEQIFNRLRDMKENHQLDDSKMARCARYLTKKVFEGMKEYFGSARIIQKWLNDIARLIASSVPESELNDTEKRISDWAVRNGLVPDFDVSLIPEVEEPGKFFLLIIRF
jgi:DNA-directed RNA polymerase